MDLGEQINTLLRDVLPQLGEDARKVMRAQIEARLAAMNLVTREEFEVQKRVLQRTRERVEALERQLALLERRPTP